MKVSEILQIEQDIKGSIILHREGLFWRAYEYSAYLLHIHYRKFRIIRKPVKYLNRDIIYCGFPDGSLQGILYNFIDKDIKKDNDQIIIEKFEFTENEFYIWKNSIKSIIPVKEDDVNNIDVKNIQWVIEKIIKFPVIHKSPIECQQFILQLQTELHGTLH